MTTIDPTAHVEPLTDAPARAAGSSFVGTLASWLITSDHKRLGRLLFGSGLVALIGIAAVGGLLGFERADANLVDNGALAQLFALHRIGLAYFVVLPLVLGLAAAIVPLQLGARSLALPRVAAAGFWTWLFGSALVILSLAANGGPHGGATKFVSMFIAAYGVVLVGLAAIALSLATTVLTTRAPGMNMRRVPLFSWSVLVAALGIVLVLPVALGAVIYLWVSYRYNRLPFGGNAGLLGTGPDSTANWLGFTLTQPVTFLYALPVIGLFAELVTHATRRRLPQRGIVLGGLALVGVATLAGVTQTQPTLPWTGSKLYLGDLFWDKAQSLVSYAFLVGLPLLGAVIVLLVAPMAFKGVKPRISAALAFALFGFLLVLLGMVANLLTGIEELHLLGTVYEEGVFVVIGYGTVLGIMGGIVHWGPKLWGRTVDDKKVAPLLLLGIAAAVLAAVPYGIAGFANQPAESATFDYSGPQDLWNMLSGIGHALMLLTVLAFIGLALQSFRKGPAAGDDPFDGVTLEWATSSPPPDNNFAAVPTVASAQPLLDLKPATDSEKS